jgi:hypothetical protein
VARPSAFNRHHRPLIGTESPPQPPHSDADIILKTHLALVRGTTRKHAQLR